MLSETEYDIVISYFERNTELQSLPFLPKSWGPDWP